MEADGEVELEAVEKGDADVEVELEPEVDVKADGELEMELAIEMEKEGESEPEVVGKADSKVESKVQSKGEVATEVEEDMSRCQACRLKATINRLKTHEVDSLLNAELMIGGRSTRILVLLVIYSHNRWRLSRRFQNMFLS